MDQIIARKSFSISAADLKRQLQEEREFKTDRYYNGRLRYMAHADGYVMVRYPRAVPIVMTEKAWRALPFLESADR